LLVPAVQKVRAAAARTQCINNLKQIGLAVHNYESSNKKLPYAVLDYQPGWSGSGSYDSGFVLILPYLEQDVLARKWNPNLPTSSTDDSDGDGYTNAILQKMPLPVYTCPVMSPPSATFGGSLGSSDAVSRAPSSYIWCTGTPTAYMSRYGSWASLPSDGAIVPIRNAKFDPVNGSAQFDKAGNAPVRLVTITDGTSNTLLVGECDFQPAGVASTYGPVWAYGYLYNWSGTAYGINRRDGLDDANFGAFRSQHDGGVNFCMADGSVQFIAQSIQQQVFTALGTRAGNDIASIP
jgi:prepilin-type processing-associated H-X9-DG protein